MKKLILALVFVFGVSTVFNANSKSLIKNKEVTLFAISSEDCWAQADAAEEAFCGYVGCSYEYWVGYMDSCLAKEQ